MGTFGQRCSKQSSKPCAKHAALGTHMHNKMRCMERGVASTLCQRYRRQEGSPRRSSGLRRRSALDQERGHVGMGLIPHRPRPKTISLGFIQPGQLARPPKHPTEHRGIQAAGVCVAQRRMVATQQMEPIRQHKLRPMSKRISRSALNYALQQEISQISIPGNLSQANHYFYPRESSNLTRKMA